MKLHLGCGNVKLKGWINCDISEEVKPDKIVNLEEKLPFKDNSVDEVYMSHVLEHTQRPIEVMKEIYRICKNKTIVRIHVPYFCHESAFSMIDHYSYFTLTTFDVFDGDSELHWQGVGNFKTISKELKWRRWFKPFEWIFNMNSKMQRIYQELWNFFPTAKELHIELKVVK